MKLNEKDFNGNDERNRDAKLVIFKKSLFYIDILKLKPIDDSSYI